MLAAAFHGGIPSNHADRLDLQQTGEFLQLQNT
jgi:hypothetical protein